MKVGRNEICPCGSGYKYKKCCASQKDLSLQTQMPLSLAQQQSEERLKERIQKTMGNRVTLLQGETEVKMSEVIFHLAEDLLRIAKTKSQKQKAIMVTCMAWNLAVMFSADQRKEKLEAFLSDFEDVQNQQDLGDIIHMMIEKKNYYYPHIDRIIIDHELVGNHNDFHLNVVSTIHPESLIQQV